MSLAFNMYKDQETQEIQEISVAKPNRKQLEREYLTKKEAWVLKQLAKQLKREKKRRKREKKLQYMEEEKKSVSRENVDDQTIKESPAKKETPPAQSVYQGRKTFLSRLGDVILKTIPTILRVVTTAFINAIVGHGFKRDRKWGGGMA